MEIRRRHYSNSRFGKTAARSAFAVALLAVAGFFGPAGAAPVTFSARLHEEMKVADAELVDVQGAPHVALNALVAQLGGGCSLAPGQVQFDLASKSAQVKPGQNLVRGSVGAFELSCPIVENNGNVYIAVADVAPFFEKAFRVAIKQNTTVPPQSPAPSPEPAPAEPAIPASSSADPEKLLDSTEPLTPLEVPATVPDAAPEQPVELTPIGNVPVGPAVPAPSGRPVLRKLDTCIIDAGHGGGDAGCIGAAGLTESALTLAVAERLKKAIEKEKGLKVVLTREKDAGVSRRERINAANSQNGDLFISLHAGGSLTPARKGFAIFCQKPAAAPVKPQSVPAGDAYSSLSPQLAEKLAANMAATTEASNGGIHSIPCHVLREVAMPAVLLEMGCLTNADEEALLKSEAYQEKIAQALAEWVRSMRGAPEGGAQ